MRPLDISINTLSLAPAPLGEQVETVARMDIRGISPDLDQVIVLGPTETARTVRDAGLQVAALTHRAFGFASAAEAEAAQARLLRTLDVAVRIGAGTIVMTTGGRGALSWAGAAERFAEAMSICSEAARTAGVHLGIEPTSHLYSDVSIAHRLSDAVGLARMAGIGVVIDLFACWTDRDIDQAIADAGSSIGLIQISDYVYGDRSLPCRAVPGDGVIPLERLIPAIVQAGFSGWLDLEIIGPRIEAEGHQAGLCRAVGHIRRILEGTSA